MMQKHSETAATAVTGLDSNMTCKNSRRVFIRQLNNNLSRSLDESMTCMCLLQLM